MKPLKPAARIGLMIFAIVLAAGLSYSILRDVAPAKPKAEDMETQAPVSASALPAGKGELAPVRFYDAGGKPVGLADFKGEVLLVNLWATWCPPCVAELPSLDTLQAKLKDKGLHVVAISMDNKPVSDVAAFLAARNVEQLALYIDTDREVPRQWPYAGIPQTFLIGRDGKVIATFEGPQKWDEGPLFDKIAAALK